MKLSNFKLKTKILTIMLILFTVAVLMAVIAVFNQKSSMNKSLILLEESIRRDYDTNIKNLVESVISMLNEVYDGYEAGKYDLDEAKQIAADLVRNMSYGQDSYFWIDTYEGVNVVYLGREEEGKSRIDQLDVNGFPLIQAIIENGKKEGGGFTDYWFPKPNETDASPKRSYSLAFEPFQWVVGTGNYTDHIDEYINSVMLQQKKQVNSMIVSYVIFFAITMLIAGAISFYILHDLRISFDNITNYFKTLATGDFTCNLPAKLIGRKDDFGLLADEIAHMKDAVTSLVISSKQAAESMIDAVYSINNDIKLLNENITEVAASSEELAANMEETAATAQEMSAISAQIEAATKMISEKSQEAAMEVAGISERALNTKQNIFEFQKKTDEVRLDIEQRMEEALEDVKVISDISIMTNTIMKITSRTNLLSVNASIEAARAGENAKSFSVVADEIRGLAAQSKNAAAQIQAVTEKITGAMFNLSNSSKELLEFLSNDISSSFEQLLKVTQNYHNDIVYIDNIVTDFSATAQELFASIENIMIAVKEVADAANQGAQGTDDIAGRIAEITSLSAKVSRQTEALKDGSGVLQRKISRFIV